MICDACDALYINGVLCHETGCPEAWRDYTRECAWCGTEFEPEERDQDFCDESCAISYNGGDSWIPCPDCDDEGCATCSGAGEICVL